MTRINISVTPFFRRLFCFICCLFSMAHAFDTITVDVNRTGRKILHDGFLMEWSTKTAQKWGHTGIWVWDAIVTPEGIAGYFRTASVPACSSWTITAHLPASRRTITLRLPPDSLSSTQEFRLDRQEYDSSGNITVEWLFPKPQEPGNNTSSPSIVFQGLSDCGDTLPVLWCRYASSSVPQNTKTKLIVQGLSIVLLALFYFFMQRKIRRQMQKKGSPHQ